MIETILNNKREIFFYNKLKDKKFTFFHYGNYQFNFQEDYCYGNDYSIETKRRKLIFERGERDFNISWSGLILPQYPSHLLFNQPSNGYNEKYWVTYYEFSFVQFVKLLVDIEKLNKLSIFI